MSKHLFVSDERGRRLSDSALYLEDESLGEIMEAAAGHRPPMAWTLFADFYADAEFGPEQALQLAGECHQLAGLAGPAAAVWLLTISTLAHAAHGYGWNLKAVAD